MYRKKLFRMFILATYSNFVKIDEVYAFVRNYQDILKSFQYTFFYSAIVFLKMSNIS